MKRILALAALISATNLAAQEPGQAHRDVIAEAVRIRLSDPTSAQFRWLPIASGTLSYCGYVNARNRFGGYIGFVPFLAISDPAQTPPAATIIEMGTGNPTSFESRFVREQCTKEGYDMADPGITTELAQG